MKVPLPVVVLCATTIIVVQSVCPIIHPTGLYNSTCLSEVRFVETTEHSEDQCLETAMTCSRILDSSSGQESYDCYDQSKSIQLFMPGLWKRKTETETSVKLSVCRTVRHDLTCRSMFNHDGIDRFHVLGGGPRVKPYSCRCRVLIELYGTQWPLCQNQSPSATNYTTAGTIRWWLIVLYGVVAVLGVILVGFFVGKVLLT